MRFKTDLRYELKYLISQAQQQALMDELAQEMSVDSHGDARGQYAVTSIYFDTADYKAYWDKLEGHRSRRKVRVRVYGDQVVTPETPVFLEVKERLNTRMRKRRVVLPYALALDLARYDELLDSATEEDPTVAHQPAALPPAEMSLTPGDQAVVREVYYLSSVLQLEPSCLVRYDRVAFEGHAIYPDLRVTFDTNLRGRVHDLSLLSTAANADQFFLAPERVILEVKANHNVPYWLTQLLNRHGCVFHRISKYCTALERNKVIVGRQRIVHGITPR